MFFRNFSWFTRSLLFSLFKNCIWSQPHKWNFLSYPIAQSRLHKFCTNTDVINKGPPLYLRDQWPADRNKKLTVPCWSLGKRTPEENWHANNSPIVSEQSKRIRSFVVNLHFPASAAQHNISKKHSARGADVHGNIEKGRAPPMIYVSDRLPPAQRSQ